MDQQIYNLIMLGIEILGTIFAVQIFLFGIFWRYISNRFKEIDQRFEKIEHRMEKIEGRMDSIDRRLLIVETTMHVQGGCQLRNDSHLKKVE